MRIVGVQSDPVWEDRDANLDTYEQLLDEAAALGADLVVLPEMFAVGFSMEAEKLAEPPDGPTTEFLVEQARELGIHVCGSLPLWDAHFELPTNCLTVASPDGVIARYRKIHPFSHSGEHHHYAAGSDFETVVIDDVRVTLFVCYDLRFADEFWATATDTDVYVVPANWPAKRAGHWSALLVARAIENQAYVVGVNRVGTDGNGLEYLGDSAIVDPMGVTLASARKAVTFVVADVSAEEVAATRERYRFMPDRR